MIRSAALALVLLILGPTLALAQQRPAAPPVRPIQAVKIILVGDSTTQVGSGWGGAFCANHVTSFIACVDLARGGRSSMSYRAEGSWALAEAEMSARGFQTTYVLIQFGHNDQPGKPGRSTDLATEFPVNMARYVREARAHGAIPILVTPLTRRQFVNGQLQNDLAAWAETVRRVAAETQAPLLDLNADSAAAVQALGPALSARFAQAPPSQEVSTALFTGTTAPAAPATPPAASTAPHDADPLAIRPPAIVPADPVGTAKLAFDYTHLGPEGADFFAAMVTRELIQAEPVLRRNLIP